MAAGIQPLAAARSVTLHLELPDRCVAWVDAGAVRREIVPHVRARLLAHPPVAGGVQG